MWATLENPLIVEGPWIAFFGVAEYVLDGRRAWSEKAPLDAGGKRGAAPATQARVLDLVQGRRRVHVCQRMVEGLVATSLLGKFIPNVFGSKYLIRPRERVLESTRSKE